MPKILYKVPPLPQPLPCGYVVINTEIPTKLPSMEHPRMKELQDHYATCPHRFCQWRKRAIDALLRKGRAYAIKRWDQLTKPHRELVETLEKAIELSQQLKYRYVAAALEHQLSLVYGLPSIGIHNDASRNQEERIHEQD